MISKGDPSLGEASDDFNLKPIDLSSDYLRFRCNKAYDPTSPISLSDLGGTVTSLQREANATFYNGGTNGADARKIQQTKYDPKNIISSSSTEGKSQYNASKYPNGIKMSTRIDRRNSSADCAIGQVYLGKVPSAGGTYDIELYWSANSTSGCLTKLEVLVWSDGWFKGTPSYYLDENLSGGSNSFNFTLPAGTKPWLTIIAQCTVQDGKYWQHEYISEIGRLVCTRR